MKGEMHLKATEVDGRTDLKGNCVFENIGIADRIRLTVAIINALKFSEKEYALLLLKLNGDDRFLNDSTIIVDEKPFGKEAIEQAVKKVNFIANLINWEDFK